MFLLPFPHFFALQIPNKKQLFKKFFQKSTLGKFCRIHQVLISMNEEETFYMVIFWQPPETNCKFRFNRELEDTGFYLNLEMN